MDDLADRLPRTAAVIAEGIQEGLHYGVQVYVSLRGEVVADGAMGNNRDGVPLTSETLMPWLSSGKPLTAVVLLRLVEQGQLSLYRPVAEILPEFARHGKERITPFHLLTHTAGLEPLVSGWPQQPWKEIIAQICRARLLAGWIPGERGAYDPARTWFVLGEMIHRIDGRAVERVAREDLFEPLGMVDSWMSMPRHLHEAYGDRIGVMHVRKDGQLTPTKSHSDIYCRAPAPGSSCRGPMRELARFYEMLLAGGERQGRRYLSAEQIGWLTHRQRSGIIDETFRHVVDFGLGVILDSNQYGPETVPYGYGRHCSPRTFGHGGAQSSVGFADPEHGLVVCVAANGCPGEPLHNRRFRDLNSAIYEDLGLV